MTLQDPGSTSPPTPPAEPVKIPGRRPRKRVAPPAFDPPNPPPPPTPEEAPAAAASPPDPDDDAFGSGWPDAEPEDQEPTKKPRGSSRESFASQAEMRDALAEGVRALTLKANDVLSRDELERDVYGAWIASEEEAAGIAGPAASIAARRGVASAASPDLADLIHLGWVLGIYVGRQVSIRFQLRRHRRAIVQGEPWPPPAAPDEEPTG